SRTARPSRSRRSRSRRPGRRPRSSISPRKAPGRLGNTRWRSWSTARRRARKTSRSSTVAHYWILKTDADTYSFDDLVPERRTVWDGVSNARALKHIGSMAAGDQAFIYHSGDDKALVGLARIVSEPYPDPKAKDPRLYVMDIEAGDRLARPVTLAEIK